MTIASTVEVQICSLQLQLEFASHRPLERIVESKTELYLV